MNWKKRLTYFVLGATMVATAVGIAGCGNDTKQAAPAEKMKVVTTVFPVYDVAKQLGGDKVDVSLLVPPGAEPHDWDPTSKDLKEIGTAKVFLYSGAGLEPTEKILEKDVLQKAEAVELSKALTLLPAPDEDEDEHDHDHDKDHDQDKDHKDDKHDNDKAQKEDKHEHEHEHGEYDPHVWLDPMNVAKEVDAVVEAFSKADPANAKYYAENGKAYKEKLQALHAKYEEFSKTQHDKHLVVSHMAFGYLANAYGFEQLGIMGVSPDAEPTPERMADIVAFIKEHNVKAIFSEELVSPKLANAIAAETGVKVYVLNPAEGLTEEQAQKNVTYLDIMEENLKTLKEALAH